MKQILALLSFLAAIGGTHASFGSPGPNGSWIGELTFVFTDGHEEHFQDCVVKMERTEKTFSFVFENSCKRLNSADGPFDIVLGNQLFINGFRLGYLTKNGFDIDFTDVSQGYVNRLQWKAVISPNGNLHVTHHLKGGGWDESYTGDFKPTFRGQRIEHIGGL